MHRFFSLACAVAAATSLVVACGSSDDSGSGNSGGSGGSAGSGTGGTSSDQKCAAPAYTDIPAQDFASKATAGKSCSGDADLAQLCAEDLAGLGASCGKTCLLQAGADDAAQATCVAACINQGLSSPLSDGCMACYTADVQCARKQCLATCVAGPTSAACLQCRVEKGCLPTFYACSGAPVPTGIDLGASGAGNTTGDAGGGS